MTKKRPRVPATRTPAVDTDRADRERRFSAFHEAGHAIVAHAVGRRPVYIRSSTLALEVGDSDNRYNVPIKTMGFLRCEPSLAAEVNGRYTSGLAFTPGQQEWPLQEAVVTLGGPIGQSTQSGRESAMGSAGDDLEKHVMAARLLGRVQQVDGRTTVDPAFSDAAFDAADAILLDLNEPMVSLAELLCQTPVVEGQLLEDALAGSPRGSHVALLDGLRAQLLLGGDEMDVGSR
jgi:hypothetical protein